jgi:hypothetical protein
MPRGVGEEFVNIHRTMPTALKLSPESDLLSFCGRSKRLSTNGVLVASFFGYALFRLTHPDDSGKPCNTG